MELTIYDKLEQLIRELRKFEHIHICQEVSFKAEEIKMVDGVRELVDLETVTRLTMYEFVDRRKFDEYKLIITFDYSDKLEDSIMEVLFGKLEELKAIYTEKEV